MTDDLDVSTWLREALAATSPPVCHDFREEAPAEVLPGDICVVVPFERASVPGRLFLVTEAGDGWCVGMLAGVETELATEVDAVIPARESGLGYEVAVHSRFHGPVWVTQILRRVGAIESTVLDQIEKLAWNDDADVAVDLGDTLQPEGVDPRYPALRRMSAELDVLTEHCRRCRNEFTQPILDPVLGDLDVLRVLLRERGWETRIHEALSSPGFRDRLLRAIPRLSRDERRVVMPLVERATLGSTGSASAAVSSTIENHVDANALAGAARSSNTNSPATIVLSHRLCWQRAVGHPARLRLESRETILIFAAVSDVPLQEAA